MIAYLLLFVFSNFVNFIFVLVIVTYSVEIALLGGTVVGIASFAEYLRAGELNVLPFGASLLAAGAALLFLIVCILATKVTAKLSKKILIGIKMIFIGRGDK